MLTRTITGVVFLLVMVSAILFDPVSLLALLSLITIMCMAEFYSVQLLKRIRTYTVFGIVIGIFSLLITYGVIFYSVTPLAYFLLVPAVLSIPVIELYHKSSRPIANIANTVWGIIYIAFPASFALAITSYVMGKGVYRPWMLLAMFIFIWLNDTGAYITGRFLGKHKLFERISPKKTIEGAIGGIVIAIGGSCVIAMYVTELTILQWNIAALIVAVTAIYGDLIESLFKRYFDIKDSGNSLPGHGGFFDRFDSFIFATPFYFVYLLILNFI